jgi:hypothetical protein
VLAAASGPAAAADLCEGCWELAGRASWIEPGSEAGARAAAGPGILGGFRFRPFWSVDFAIDRHATQVPDGPDETLTTISSSFTYTFRSGREQRTRPLVHLTLGLVRDAVASRRTTIPSGSGRLPASSGPDADGGVLYAFGGGALTHLTSRTFLRYDARFVRYSTFGATREAIQISVGAGARLGR